MKNSIGFKEIIENNKIKFRSNLKEYKTKFKNQISYFKMIILNNPFKIKAMKILFALKNDISLLKR